MKTAKLLFLCLLAMSLFGSGIPLAWGEDDEDCANCDPPECDPDDPCCEEGEDGENKFSVFSADVNRMVMDIKLAAKVGEYPLGISRFHSSRTTWADQHRSDFIFGRAGNWRHSYQWRVMYDGETNGCRKLEVVAPDGRVSYYNKKSSNDLFMTYLPSTHSRVWPDGSTNYYLYQIDGTKYHITQSTDGTNYQYRMEGFWDAYSNWYGFAYETNGYLTRVTGPNTNHFFELEYRDLEGAAAPGWIHFTYTNVLAAEVLIPGTWNGWTGTVTRMETNSSGTWEADVELSEGFYRYKFSVRNQGSSTWTILADPDNPLVVGPNSDSLAVVSAEKIIERVTAGDGRSVDYVYDWDWNDGQQMLVMRLREAQYGSGESALYDYYPASYDGNRTMLLTSVDAPHVNGSGRAMLYTYHTNRPYSGQIHEERFLTNSQLVARLEFDPSNSVRRSVVNGAGTTNEYEFATGCGNLTQRSDALGQTWHRTYFGGDGMLQTKVDPMGRTSVYTRTWHFGALLTVSNSCGCGTDKINTFTDDTYPFYLDTQADAAGNVTTYQRDDNHRPTAIYYPDGTSEYFDYNMHGQVTVENKRDGTTWTNSYDDKGRLSRRDGPAGASIGYGYDGYNRVIAETNAVGLVTGYEYNWDGKPTRKVHPDLTEEQWFYDRYGSVTQMVSRSGGITTYGYDNQGRIVRTENPVGAVTETTYDIKGRKVLETSPGGLVVSNNYDSIGRRIRRTYFSDNTYETWTYVYDGLSAYTNRLGAGTTLAYDAKGNITSITDARGNTTLYAYDQLKRVVATENALDEITSRTFDSEGRITSVSDSIGLAISNTYNANGQLMQTILRGSVTNEYEYDILGRRTNIVLNGYSISADEYDAVGRTVWTRNADGLVINKVYNSKGQHYRTYMNDGTYWEYVYTNGWLWKTVDRAGRTSITERNVVGRPVQVIDPAGRTVQYRYDISGNLTNLVDQAGNNTYWNYNTENRQIRKTYMDSTHWDFTYDANGRLSSRTDAKTQTTYYYYDAVGNLTNVNYPNDADVYFTYDALNRRMQINDGIGTTTYAFSSCCGLPESEDGPFVNDTLYFSYTDAKQLVQMTSAFLNVEYTYDELLRLKTIVGPEGTNTYSYEGAGAVWRELEMGNGTAVTRQYDDMLRLTNMMNNANASVLSSFAMSYDNADHRTQVIREDGTRYEYSYDAIGQLTNAAATLVDDTPWQAYRFGYQYDATGNPVEHDKNGLIYSNSFNNLNQNVSTLPGGSLAVLGRVSCAGGTVTVNSVQAQLAPDLIFATTGIPFVLGTNALDTVFTDPYGRSTNRQTTVMVSQKTYRYDANGNLTNDGRIAYLWDDENRLVAARSARSGALLQENRYDGLGRRREKVVYAESGAITNCYIYRDWLVMGVRDGAGNVLETYTHGIDLSGQVGGSAGGIGSILASTRADGTANYHYDFNGNVVQVSGSNQAQLAKYTYSAFGEILLKDGAFDSRYQFSTKEYDISVGLNYYGYRFYDSTSGRWINRDPFYESAGMNLYSFTANSPLTFVDPLGNSIWSDFQDALNTFEDCYNGMKSANDSARKWWDDIQDDYTCCVDGEEVSMSDFPGAVNGDADSTYGVLHCALGVAAKENGVTDACLDIANALWEAYEAINPAYWEWFPQRPSWWPSWMPWKDGSKGLEGWLKDTLSDMNAVKDGYGKGSKEECIPDECKKD